jgi:hypothetical protein
MDSFHVFIEYFWIFDFLNFWIFFFDFLDFWIFGFWDFWIFRFLDFGIYLILGATGHGCSAEGTDAAPRAHGTGALQASQTYVRTALIDFPFDRRGLFLARVDQMIRTALIDFPFDRGGPFAWPASIK